MNTMKSDVLSFTLHCCPITFSSARTNLCNIGMFRVPPVTYLLYQKVCEHFLNQLVKMMLFYKKLRLFKEKEAKEKREVNGFSQNLNKCLGQDLEIAMHDGDLHFQENNAYGYTYSGNSETLFLKSRYQYFYTSFHASKKQVMSAYNEHVLQMTHCGKIQAGNGRKRWATSAFTKMITPPHLSMQLEGRHVKCQYFRIQ